MPIIASTTLAAPLSVSTERWSIIGNDGTSWDLSTPTTNGMYAQPGQTGWLAPPYTLNLIDLLGNGALLGGVRATPRYGTFAVIFRAESQADLRADLGAFVSSMNPRYGDVTVRCTQPDGTARQIACRYLQGMEGDESVDARSHWTQKMVMRLVAVDPFYSSLTDQIASWQAPNVVQFFDLFLDGRQFLTADSVLGSLLIGNPGDEDAYPVWNIAGTMTAATFTNSDTGEAFTLTYTQTTGNLTIDTRPGQLTVVNQASTNLWPNLSANPVLWALHPGDNAVNLSVSGTDATTLVTLTYTPRYLTP